MEKQVRYIFVTGGVVSGLGKGISAASLGRLLKARGLRVAAQKLDPYVNVDPGTMSPYQHGEVFVTEDGAETDLDLGHYERFIDEDLNRYSNLTSGRVYWEVLHKERRGEYLGSTVQVIPHVTGEIKGFIAALARRTEPDVIITEIGGTIGDIESQPFLEAIRQLSREVGRQNCLFLHVVLVPYLRCSGEHKTKPAQHSVRELRSLGIIPDVIITEIGGTIGDIESQPFLEAIRQLSREVGRQNCLFLHVVLVPYLRCSGEHKTKPAQHSVRELRSLGIIPDVIIARCDEPLEPGILDKLALFCDVPPEHVIENRTLGSLYHVPLMLHRAGLDRIVCDALGLAAGEPDLAEWEALCRRVDHPGKVVKIALVGKYVELHDAYLSVAEALRHGGYENDARVDIRWVDSEQLTREKVAGALAGCDGVIVPGGFGDRGIGGMVEAARYAREQKLPYFGICLGMQVAVIEAARDLLGLSGADSAEFAPDTPHPVIHLMPDQRGEVPKGGTMRLGAYPCRLLEGSRLRAVYGQGEVAERHRHRYEVNNDYRPLLEGAGGLTLCGQSPDGRLVEAIERKDHPFFVGVQYHPEFRSRPNRAHPLFRAFVEAALDHRASGETSPHR